MEITETLSDGLKREFQIQVPAADLEARLTERLGELKDSVQLRGFRPGKVPMAHLRKIYGKAVMAETIEALIRELNAKVVTDHGLKLAMEPKVTIPNEETEVDKVIGGQSDLAYTLSLEVLPKIELADFKGIKLERPVAEVTDAQVSEALERIAEQNRPFAAKGEGGKVEKGDRVVIDFTGKLEGEPFEGGTGGDVGVNVGSGTFIPGFEDQLIGMAAGETRQVKVTFPGNYMNAQLAGKDAEFEVTAKTVEAPGTVTRRRRLCQAARPGIARQAQGGCQRTRMQQEHAGLSRQQLKRQLLDKLDEMHKFALPPTLVEEEFKNVWNAVDSDLKAPGPHLRRRRHDRREGAGGISRHRRAARPARAGACRDRREEQDQGDRRRDLARHRRARPPGARPRAGDLGVLPARIPVRWQRCGRRSSRRRWSTSWSSSPR